MTIALLPAVSEVEDACTLVLTVLSARRRTISDALREGGAGSPRIDIICWIDPVVSWADVSGRMAAMVPV